MIIQTGRRALPYNPWNFDAEPGDIMVTDDGRAFRLYESSGRNKSAAGELSMRRWRRPGYIAGIKDDCLIWIPDGR